MNETTRIMNKANETMARNSRERLNLAQKITEGEMGTKKALEILDEQEKRSTGLIADIDRQIEKLEKGSGKFKSLSLVPGLSGWMVKVGTAFIIFVFAMIGWVVGSLIWEFLIA